MRLRSEMLCGAALLVCFAAAAMAQEGGQGRGRGGGFGGFGGASRLALLRIEAVQKELDLSADQIAAIQKLSEELRPMRGGGGGGGEGAPPRRRRNQGDNNDARLGAPAQWYFVQQDQPRRQISDEDRARFREQAEARAKKEREELAKILKPDQLKRLNEIYLRVAGTAALNDSEVAKQLEISDEQKEKLGKVREEAMTSNREEMRELFQSGDREKIQARMAEIRKATDEKILAVLTDEQKKKFEDMKGKPFELPEGALRGAFGGGAGRRGGGNRPGNN